MDSAYARPLSNPMVKKIFQGIFIPLFFIFCLVCCLAWGMEISKGRQPAIRCFALAGVQRIAKGLQQQWIVKISKSRHAGNVARSTCRVSQSHRQAHPPQQAVLGSGVLFHLHFNSTSSRFHAC